MSNGNEVLHIKQKADILIKHQDLLKLIVKLNKWIMQELYANRFLAPQGIHQTSVALSGTR